MDKIHIRVEEQNINKQGLLMTIIRYKNCNDIDIQFEDGVVQEHTKYSRFVNGTIVNYNVPSYLGVGYRGYGKYTTRKNNVKTEEYIKWGSMLTRCYSDKLSQRENYKDCSVCNEWLNFQNFAEWYNENKYTLPFNERVELDKDILLKGNKIYMPERCLLVPKRINSIILNRHNERGKCVLGVFYNRNLNKYQVSVNDGSGGNIYLGLFKKEEDAFSEYVKCKKEIIFDVANQYKPYIPNTVYDAIINYKISVYD